MAKFYKGDILRLSPVGLDHLYKNNPRGMARAIQWQFEYRCRNRSDPECICTIRVGKGYYETYHESFVEKV